MKILAIRGKNLASLGGEFGVDFTQEPLAGAGLYAITGATGTGKSTLLDVLCLALYERTPRLQKAAAKGETIPDVGDNAVSPSDPRTILRRGTSEGFAEVDFTGNDGVAYRARWSVRRARAKAEGKLQASDMVLTRLADGERLGDHTKTETLRLIEGLVGLSFEQFTRAVLLAQNDFATFLKAPDDERAELLQTLTGTETFSTISRQAFARMKLESDLLLRLQDQLKGQQALAPEARAELASALQSQAVGLAQLQAHKALREDQLRWLQQLAKLQHEAAEAGVLVAAAVTAHDAAAARRAHLQRVDQVQSARPLWAEQQRLTQALATGTQTLQQANAQQEQAQQQLQICKSAFAAAQAQLAEAEGAWAQQQPSMARARELDASALALTPEVQAAAEALAQAQSQLELQLKQQAQTTADIAATQSECAHAEDWLTRHAALRVLAEGWPRWDTLLSNAQALLARQRQGETEAVTLAAQAVDNAAQQARAHTSLAQAVTEAEAVRTALDARAQAVAAIDADALARAKQSLEQERDDLQAAAVLWQQRSEVRSQRQRLQAQQATHSAIVAQADSELQQCTQQQPLLAAAQQSAEQALHLAKAAVSETAQTLRHALQADQPCPVCGATEHPYAEHSPALDAVLQGLHTHLEQAQQALLAVRERAAAARANKASAATALEQATDELRQLATRRETLLQAWTTLALRPTLDAVADTERSAWLGQHQEQVREGLVQLSLQEAEQRQNLKSKEVAQLALDAAHRCREEANEALAQWTRRADQLRQAQISLQRQQAEQAQQSDATLAQLDGAFADAQWREAWGAEPVEFAQQCQAQASSWNTQKQSHARLTQTLAALQVQSVAADASCAQAAQLVATQTARHTAVATQLHNYREARAALLQGRDVAQVEASLGAAMTQAKADLATAQTGLQVAQGNAVRLQEVVRFAQQQMEQWRAGQGAAQAALDQWLLAFQAPAEGPSDAAPITLDEVKALLALPPAWVGSERQALQDLQSAVATTQAVQATRQDSLVAHEATRTTADSVETLQQQLQQVDADLAALGTAVSALRLDLARDDERLAASSALRLQIEQQGTVAAVWSRLGELIGSADGKKFRNFAQQLTLDILLGYGNSHLHTLSRRYRIQRIQDSLGLLVVDQDMGDEVRSVHSLSGGESFLVSLAMALGLASLSSHRVRVESLFIDEGFGSLDADALRVAMDALDNLQSLGRKVGVISHVQEMTERIGTRVEVQRQTGGMSRIVVR